MNGFDFKRLQRILLGVGVLAVAGLWIGEEMGLILVAPPPAPHVVEQRQAEAPAGLVLQGVIAGNDSAPGVAILAEAGKRPVLVPEGASFNEDLQVDRVLADRVILRQRGIATPIVLHLAPMSGGEAIPPAMSTSRNELPIGRDEIPPAPADRAPGTPIEALPANRVPAPSDASGPPPGPGLTGPALPGPSAAMH
jgi:hypothetical protein